MFFSGRLKMCIRDSQGTVRFSLGWASTEADVDAALAAIRALA